MAILGDCWQRIFIRASNSDLRPWKILGFGGNIENEFELEKPKKGQVMKQSLTYFLIHLHPNISGPELFNMQDSNDVHTDDVSELVLASETD
jgi:hypothetical protein